MSVAAVQEPTAFETMETKDENDLSDEDHRLQEELRILVERLQSPCAEIYLATLETIRQLIRSSTTSITSVPKPLKYMVPHYDKMKKVYWNLVDKKTRESCADIISVLAMTMGSAHECIFYRFRGDPNVIVCDWGHEYVRHLSSEIAAVWPTANSSNRERLVWLVRQIVPYTIAHNAEAEACDLLIEIDKLDYLEEFIDRDSYPKILLYLQSCAPFVPEPENGAILNTALNLAIRFQCHHEAMRIAFMLNDIMAVKKIFTSCDDYLVKFQLAFLIGRQRSCFDVTEITADLPEDLAEVLMNSQLNTYFLNLARELDILEGKTPEDVYKSHLDHPRFPMSQTQADSARNNLASSFVNGMTNAGFGTDKMFLDYGNKWIYKNKEHGIISATASIGLLRLWDIDGGLAIIDKYLYSQDDFVKSGSLLACGILNCGIRNEVEPAHALLSDYLGSTNQLFKVCSILGIGIAYSGSNSALALESLRSNLSSDDDEILGVTAISIGLIAVGTCNPDFTEALLQVVIMLSAKKAQNSYARFVYLALGLLYMARQAESETLMESLRILDEPFQSYAKIVVEMCAYAGSGNVLKVQHLLHICSEHSDSKKKFEKTDDEKTEPKSKRIDFSDIQSVSVLGVALIAMGEDIGTEMAFRSFGHLMRYGEPSIRRSVPHAIALSSISNPKFGILDMLNKFSHDHDSGVAYAAIFALGLVGAGTNKARLALLLRQLAQYYAKDPNNLFLVRISQGLTHLGKGTMTMSPYHSDKQIMRPVAVAAILVVLFAAMDMKNLILGPAHYLLYNIVPAIEPRCLMTFDEKLNHLQVAVRVGIAVDTVAQAGKPKTITGFQTNTTPVLLAAGERAELATDEYIPLTNTLEGFVILRKNPTYVCLK